MVEAVEATPVIVQGSDESSDELFPSEDGGHNERGNDGAPPPFTPDEDGVPQAVREAQKRAAAKAAADRAHKKKQGSDDVKSPEQEAFESGAVLRFNPTAIPAKHSGTKPFTSCASAPPQKRKKQ